MRCPSFMSDEHTKPDKFPTSVSMEQLYGPKFKPDPPKSGMRRFWFICVPVGFVLGFALSVIIGANIWLPAWGISTLLIWAVGAEGEK
jgi:hypothetical protein